MKSIFVINLIAIFGLVVCHPVEEKYSTKFDNIDAEQILQSDRLLSNYFNCVMTGEGCTPDGKELRETLPDVLKTGCSRCNDHQKARTKKVVHFLIDNKPEMYKQLEAKFDPEGIFQKQYKANFGL